MTTYPIGPLRSSDGRETITHVTFIDPTGDDDFWVARIDAETGEVEMFPDPPET